MADPTFWGWTWSCRPRVLGTDSSAGDAWSGPIPSATLQIGMARLRLSFCSAATIVIVGLGFASLVAGCGADYADPPADGSGGTGNEAGSGNDVRLPPLPATGDCTTGVVQECTVYYEVGGIQNCYVGVQLCVEGEWDTCTDQEVVDAMIDELGYDDLASGGDGGAGGAGGAGG